MGVFLTNHLYATWKTDLEKNLKRKSHLKLLHIHNNKLRFKGDISLHESQVGSQTNKRLRERERENEWMEDKKSV